MRNDGTSPQWIVNLVNAYETIEGKGNNVNDQVLRGYGLSEENYQYYVKKMGDPGLTDFEGALFKSIDNHRKLIVEMPGYVNAPIPIKKMVLDLAYNTNDSDPVNPKIYPKLMKAMGDNNWIGAIVETLDSANESGYVMPGLMKRRAWAANDALSRIPQRVFGEFITAREKNQYLEMFGGLDIKTINKQIETGGLYSQPIRSVSANAEGKYTYWDIDGNAIFRGFNEKGLHPKSHAATGVPDIGLEDLNMQRVEYGH